MDIETLIDQTAASVAPGYADLDLSRAVGVLLWEQYSGDVSQLTPLALELTELDEHVQRDGEQRELGYPHFDPASEAGASCAALTEALEAADDGYVLIETYWLALATRLHALLGMPVLVDEIETPVSEQLRRQSERPNPDPLAGLDVIVSTPVDEHRHAGLYRRDGMTFGAAHLPNVADEWLVERGLTELGRSPQVVAGGMPRGAVAAEVRDRKGVWHAAVTAPGLWLCVLPQRSGQSDPEVRFMDAVRAPVTDPEDDFSAGVPREDEVAHEVERRVLAGARVPVLWLQGRGRPDLYAWEGEPHAATALGVAGNGCRLWIGPTAQDPRRVFEEHLVRDWGYGPETAALRVDELPIGTLEGTVDGQPVTFALAAPGEPWMDDEGWVAVAQLDSYAVAFTGYDRPPERLDLERI
ncbi:hypothetical protein OJ997_07120 [Solirubrobacter phytolaccae]|uniref:Uncharacterized protein n=1 Tax=Solirubrobacter phytolaccae TaxID=1404360 RepID=A0A9X3N5W3_9ACTN|nr:hypothetical protein [Solirubrobacter phytolaccae]MDA0180061.1 hypothetical protein [Solirubrobacter phytolaccae]